MSNRLLAFHWQVLPYYFAKEKAVMRYDFGIGQEKEHLCLQIVSHNGNQISKRPAFLSAT